MSVPGSVSETKPVASMYGIFTYIYHKSQVNVGNMPYMDPMGRGFTKYKSGF